MDETITWLAEDVLPPDLEGQEWLITSEARGRTYQIRCGSGQGVVAVNLEATGKLRGNVKANGNGVICPLLGSTSHGVYVNKHSGKGKGNVCFQLLISAKGHMERDIRCHVSATPLPIQTRASGKGYAPIWSTCDLSLLFPYLSNFLPEVAEQIPTPIPEQDQIELHILDQVIKGVEFHNDTKLWTLIGVTYCNKPVMTLRNAPGSPYPLRHVTDLYQYKLMIGFLARLWQVRPIYVEGAPPGPMTQRHLEDLQRRRGLM